MSISGKTVYWVSCEWDFDQKERYFSTHEKAEVFAKEIAECILQEDDDFEDDDFESLQSQGLLNIEWATVE